MQRIIAEGVKNFGDGYGGVSWILYNRMSDADAKNEIERQNLISHYGGPGQPYSRRPLVRHSVGYTLITQIWGLDN